MLERYTWPLQESYQSYHHEHQPEQMDMGDTASTAVQAQAVMLDENSAIAQHLKHSAEAIISQVVNTSEAPPPPEINLSTGASVIKDARKPRESVRHISLLNTKSPSNPCPYIKVAIHANKTLCKLKWGVGPSFRPPLALPWESLPLLLI